MFQFLRLTKYAISSRGHRLWNELTNTQTKSLESVMIFKKTIKNNLIELKDGCNYF